MSLFADDILDIENSKDSIKNLLEQTNEFSKVSEYKINIQKSVTFLYTDNKLSEIEIKKTVHLQFHQKKIRRNKFNQRRR